MFILDWLVTNPIPSSSGVQANTADTRKHRRQAPPRTNPDKTAYRLVFRAFSESPDATPEEKSRQQVKLAAIGFNSSDAAIAAEVLARYHVRYAEYLQRYEAEIEKNKNGLTKIDHGAYTAERDDVVDSTIAEFRARLSPGGMEKLAAFVQEEKRRMTIVRNPPMS
jgi:hypothetical protein